MLLNFNLILIIVTLISFSYLIGSFTFGYFFVKFFHGVDLRTIGSKNVGATNTWRAGYKILGILTFLFDALKAVIAFWFASLIIKFFNLHFSIEETKFLDKYLPISCAAFAVLGHLYSIFLKFKGGKGVSTFFGFLLAGYPDIFANLILYSAILWVSIFALKRISSVASLSVMLFSILYAFFFIENHFFKSLLIFLPTLMIVAHKENIKNLISKKQKESLKIEKN
jgi:glycerol-3-phosphate acyltransferase PlsY